MKSKLVLITSHCKVRIMGNYNDVAAVIPALPDARHDGYTIQDIREVEGTSFFLVIVSNLVHILNMFKLKSIKLCFI